MSIYRYIDSPVEFESCCENLKQQTILAVDTEFVRERTFYPQPGLIQVSDGNNIYLIDPINLDNINSFYELLENPEIKIIMHSSSEDIELFYSLWNGQIKSLFDTQIAASWLGLGQSLSLQNLILNYENIHIEKHLSRTDWLQRPLTQSQLKYAATDVLYLIDIFRKQEAGLNSKGFLSYAEQDSDLRCQHKSVQENDELAYLKVKRAITAKDSALGRLKMLAAWREKKARTEDKPRQHILKDQQLLAICIENPKTLQQLSNNRELPPFIIRRYGEEVMHELQKLTQNTSQNISGPVLSFRSIANAGNTLKDCRELLSNIQKQHDIPLEVLPSKRWLEQFLLNKAAPWYPVPEGWKGWRKELLEKPFEKIILNNKFNQE